MPLGYQYTKWEFAEDVHLCSEYKTKDKTRKHNTYFHNENVGSQGQHFILKMRPVFSMNIDTSESIDLGVFQ